MLFPLQYRLNGDPVDADVYAAALGSYAHRLQDENALLIADLAAEKDRVARLSFELIRLAHWIADEFGGQKNITDAEAVAWSSQIDPADLAHDQPGEGQ